MKQEERRLLALPSTVEGVPGLGAEASAAVHMRAKHLHRSLSFDRSSEQQHRCGPGTNPLSTEVSSVFVCEMVKLERRELPSPCLPDPHPAVT